MAAAAILKSVKQQ